MKHSIVLLLTLGLAALFFLYSGNAEVLSNSLSKGLNPSTRGTFETNSLNAIESCNNGTKVSVPGFNGTEDICSCHSGIEGSLCNVTQADNNNCSWNTLQKLKTTQHPSLVSSSFVDNTLNLVIGEHVVRNRKNTEIKIQNVNNIESCYYPSVGDYWEKDIQSCNDTFIAKLPWSKANKCNWVIDTTNNAYTSYSGKIMVNHLDEVGVLGGVPIMRETSHNIPLAIRFNKRIELSVKITVFGLPGVDAIISKLGYRFDTNDGIFELATSAIWPFTLKKASMPVSPVGIIPSNATDNTNYPLTCPETENSACTQFSQSILTIGEGTCRFTGQYEWTFDVSCRDSFNDVCPIPQGQSVVKIVADIVSEDFCTEAIIDIGLKGELTTFKDELHQVPTKSYARGDRIYLKASLSTNGQVTLQSSEFVSLFVSGVAKPEGLFLFTDQGGNLPPQTTTEGTTAQVNRQVVTGASASSPTASFLVSEEIGNIVGAKKIDAIIRVSYQDVQTKKRISELRNVRFTMEDKPTSTASTTLEDVSMGERETGDITVSSDSHSMKFNTSVLFSFILLVSLSFVSSM